MARRVFVCRSTASGRPRSANTLVEPCVTPISLSPLILSYCPFWGPLPHFKILPRASTARVSARHPARPCESRTDFSSGGVQHIDRALVAYRVGPAVCIAVKILDNIEYPVPLALPGLRVRTLAPELRNTECVPHVACTGMGRQEVAFGRVNPKTWSAKLTWSSRSSRTWCCATGARRQRLFFRRSKNKRVKLTALPSTVEAAVQGLIVHTMINVVSSNMMFGH
jgi:hypothetical protein